MRIPPALRSREAKAIGAILFFLIAVYAIAVVARISGQPHGPGHGGRIVEISGDALYLRDARGEETRIGYTAQTTVVRGREAIRVSDLSVGDMVVVEDAPPADGVADKIVALPKKGLKGNGPLETVTPPTP